MIVGTVPVKPRIIVADAGLTVLTQSSQAAEFPASALNNALTYERWMPTNTTGWATFDMGVPTTIYGACIAVHNLMGATVTIRSSDDNVTYISRGGGVPVDSSAVMNLLTTPVTARYWRVWWTGGVANSSYLGVCAWAKESLTLPECTNPTASTPLKFTRKTLISPNVSADGNWLGRSIMKQGSAGQLVLEYIAENDYASVVDPLVKRLRYAPFGIALPNGEAHYCWTTGDVQVSQPQGSYYNVSIPVEAYSDD